VSTLAPLFAAAFATRNSWDAFLSAAFQVVLGGLLVFVAGILIGSA
jgi:hypothetical protein